MAYHGWLEALSAWEVNAAQQSVHLTEGMRRKFWYNLTMLLCWEGFFKPGPRQVTQAVRRLAIVYFGV